MASEDVVVYCEILRETEKAVQVEQVNRGASLKAWIPLSQCSHLSKDAPKVKGGPRKATITMSEWIAEKSGLNYYPKP